MAVGTVKWFTATKGFGFIAPKDGGDEAFVHISAVEQAGLRTLKPGDVISYDLENGRQGRPAAVNLRMA